MNSIKDSWAEAIGLVLTEESLSSQGILITDDLIRVEASDGSAMYPIGQFSGAEDGLHRDESIIGLYNEALAPGVADGTISDYGAVTWYLNTWRKNSDGSSKPSRADEFTRSAEAREAGAQSIACLLASWRRP